MVKTEEFKRIAKPGLILSVLRHGWDFLEPCQFEEFGADTYDDGSPIEGWSFWAKTVEFPKFADQLTLREHRDQVQSAAEGLIASGERFALNVVSKEFYFTDDQNVFLVFDPGEFGTFGAS